MRPQEMHAVVSNHPVTKIVKAPLTWNWGTIIGSVFVLGILGGLIGEAIWLAMLPWVNHWLNDRRGLHYGQKHFHNFSTRDDRLWWTVGDVVVIVPIVVGSLLHWMKSAERWPWEIAHEKIKEITR